MLIFNALQCVRGTLGQGVALHRVGSTLKRLADGSKGVQLRRHVAVQHYK